MQSEESKTTDRVTRRRFISVALLLLIGVSIFVISSLLLGVIGGFILWAMSRWIFEWFERKLRGRRTLAASLSVLSLFLLVVAPVAGVLSLMVNDAVSLAERGYSFFQQLEPQLDALITRLTGQQVPVFWGYELDIELVVSKLQELAGTATSYMVVAMQKTAGGIASAVLQVLVMLYTLFFCYLDGAKFVDWIKRLLPLTSDESEQLLQNFFRTAITSLKAFGVIGVVQGVLGGLAFWACGIPSPFFWGVILVFTTIIPVVGAQIVLFPAGILLILTGKTVPGIALLLWSWIVIANIDNLLRPYLVGKAAQLHELVVFLMTIGGIAVFGFWGFLIGPVIAALLKAVAEFYWETVAS